MKILKNIFSPKTKQNTKYEPNTLAEMNGSPDLRLATAKGKEVDIPLLKSEEVKKIPKKSDRAATVNSGTSQTKSSTTNQGKIAVKETVKESVAKSTTKSASKTTPAVTLSKADATKKSSSKSTSSTKESAMKKDAKKTAEPKNSTSATARKTETAGKTTTTKSTKTAPAKPLAKPVEVKETKATQKPATSKKTTAPEKKATSEKKAATTTAKAKESASTKAAKTTTKAANTVAKKVAESKDTDIITESKVTRSGKFEIKKSKDGRFVFNLYASNSVIVATSQVYSSSTSAMNGIKSVIANAASAQIEDQSLKKVTPVPFPKWEIYQDKGDQYRFRLCASNGSCVVHSQGYTSKANCKKGIESIIKFASDAEITKVYLEKK